MRKNSKGDGRRFCREVFLWELLAVADVLMSPTATRAYSNFEDIGIQGDIARQIRRLESDAYLERQPGGKKDRLYRLTEKGRMAALAGRDPVREWRRPWDGRWRFFCFDMPADRGSDRSALWRALRERRFGCLQGSLWISPDPVEQVRRELKGDRHPASLILLEGSPCAGETDAELVESAWDFDDIAQRWSAFDSCIATGARGVERGEFNRSRFRDWAEQTRAAWRRVVDLDPFLPSSLLPRGYSGQKIWRKKEKSFRRIVQVLSDAPLRDE